MDNGEALNVPVVEQSPTPWQSALSMAQTLHEYRDELNRLTGRLLTIQEDERRRIALDLHDGLGQSLSLIKLSLENAADELALGAVDQMGQSLRQLIAQVGEALGEVRRVATALRPSILDDLGILPALSWFFRDFEAACRDVAVEKVFNVVEHEVPAPLQITIFRIIQEATHNVVKHADAERLRISLDFVDGQLCLRVEDNGKGFDPAEALASTGSGLGLFSMQQRAVLSGGSFHLASTPGAGTRIEVVWPCSAVIG